MPSRFCRVLSSRKKTHGTTRKFASSWLLALLAVFSTKLMTTCLPAAVAKLKQLVQQINETRISFYQWYQDLTPELKARAQEGVVQACEMFAKVLQLIWGFNPTSGKETDDSVAALDDLVAETIKVVQNLMSEPL